MAKETGHQPRGRDVRAAHPRPSEIVAARRAAQAQMGAGAAAAQEFCARLVHVSKRTWLSWERKEREMSAAHWELLQIKLIIHSVNFPVGAMGTSRGQRGE